MQEESVKPANVAAKKPTRGVAAKTKSATAAVSKAETTKSAAPKVKRVKIKKATKVKLKQRHLSIKLPDIELAQLVALKKSSVTIGVDAKKSELVRAGLLLLDKLSPEELKSIVARVRKTKSLKLRS